MYSQINKLFFLHEKLKDRIFGLKLFGIECIIFLSFSTHRFFFTQKLKDFSHAKFKALGAVESFQK